MATVDELLAGVSTVDKTLVISNDFRTINIPSSVPNLGVEYDDDVLRLDFKMPRYVSDTDLSKFAIRINYINSQGESDVYTVSDVKVYSQYITFTWLVGPTATRYKGNTKFIVCAKTLKSDGVIDKEFNTTIATLPVLEGLEVDEAVVTEYSDVIEQWKQELFGIGDTEEATIKAVSQTEQAAIANKGAEVLATIPVDYQTAVSMTDNADRTKSDAIIRSTESEVIRVEDSSDDYLRGLKVFGKTTQVNTTGKNLLNIPDTINTTKGVSFVVRPDRSVVATGTPTEVFAVSLYGTYGEPIAFPAGTYIVSGGVDENHYLRVRIHSADGTLKAMRYSNGVDKEFTVEDGELISISIYFATLTGVNNMTFYPMVRYASVLDNTYEPYSGGAASPNPNWPQDLKNVENPTVDIYGKNLLHIDDVDKTITNTDGINLKAVVEDGCITLSGTFNPGPPQAKVFFPDFKAPSVNYVPYATIKPEYAIKLPRGVYVFSANEVKPEAIGSVSGARLVVGELQGSENNGKAKIYADGDVITVDRDDYYAMFVVHVYSSSGQIDNFVYTAKPQLECGSTITAFEPYKVVQSIELPYTLPGIMTRSGGFYSRMDANGNKWICDEIDFERGVYIKRINELVCTGEEGWTKSSTYPAYSLLLERQAATGLCTHMNRLSVTELHEGYQGVYLEWSSYAIVQLQNYFPTLSDFEAWLAEQYANGTPVTFRYAFEVPIEIPLTAEELDWFRFAHTNCTNTTVLNDAGATMELKYNADTETYLNNCFRPTDDQVQNAVNAWLEAHYTNAEGVSF